MAQTSETLQPAEFAATAARAAEVCAGLDLRMQASRLAMDGLLGVIADEEVGGLDLPLAFAVPVIAAGNAGLLGFPLLEAVLLGRLLWQSMPRLAEAIVSGKSLATIAWQGSVAAERSGDEVVLNGWIARAPRAPEVDYILVRTGTADAALVPAHGAGVLIDEPSGLDLTVPEHAVQLRGVAIPAENVLQEKAWDLLSADANVLRAAAILGSADACLSLAQEHASTRRQFGHALAYNQAIRHSLARHKLGLEGVRHAITRSLGDHAGAIERDAAFLAAAAYGIAIGEGAIQIHGGMGFTWDVPVHRHLRHIRALQAQGDASNLMAALGSRYVATVAPADTASS